MAIVVLHHIKKMNLNHINIILFILLMNIVNVLKLRSVETPMQKSILDILYSSVNFADTRYEILKTDSQLDIIKESNGYISVQFQGIAYMILLCKIDNKKYNILISKKELRENKNDNKLHELKMFYIIFPFVHDKYYNIGTIIDGKIIKTAQYNQSFIIHELYNKELYNIDLKDKYKILASDILSNLLKITKLQFRLANLYEHKDLPSLLFDKLPKASSKVIGLMFLFRTTKSYYVYSNEQELLSIKSTGIAPDIKTYDNSIVEFMMKSTNKTDVYFLYDLEDDTEIGLAHIPNIKTSHFFSNIFNTADKIKVKCIKSEKFNKWIPMCDEYYDFYDDIF